MHAGNGQQRRLHLAELDAESAQLDLSVAAPQVFDAAVAGHRRITGEVHPAAIGIGRIRDEPGSGQVEHAGVPARDLIARDVKVAWHTVGNRAQPAVEDLGAHALDRVSDVGCVRDRDEFGRQFATRHVHGRLGRPVHVVELRPLDTGGAAVGVPAAHLLEVQRLSGEDQGAQARGQLHVVAGAQCRSELVERRRRHVDDGHALAVQDVGELDGAAGGVAVHHHQPSAADQRHPDLGDRDVEGERGEGHPGVVTRRQVVVVERGEQVDDGGVWDDHPLGCSCRPRGVHDVGGVARVHGGRQDGGRGGRAECDKVSHGAPLGRQIRPELGQLVVDDDHRRLGVGDHA